MREFLVWDIGVRLFHWGLVVCLAFSWISIDLFDAVELHALSGWMVATLLVYRILWGIIVWPKYANFVRMFRTLASVKPYARQLLRRSGEVYLGHNPLGVLAILVMFGLIILILASGLVMTDEVIYDAPFYALVPGWVQALGSLLHEIVFNLLLLVIVIHLVAIAFYTFYKKQQLVPAMLHGKKRFSTDANIVDQAIDQQTSVSTIIKMTVAVMLTCYISFELYKVFIQ